MKKKLKNVYKNCKRKFKKNDFVKILFRNPGYLKIRLFFLYHSKYKYRQVPFRQVAAIHSLVMFKYVCDEIGVDFFLRAGTLLGAVRQGAFAGRPGDIDLGVKKEGKEQILINKEKFKNNGFKINHKKRKSSIYVRYKIGPPIAIIYYEKRIYNGQVLYERNSNVINRPRNKCKKKLLSIYNENNMKIDEWRLSMAEESSIFGYEFNVPRKPKDILYQQYGKDWEKPTSKQYSWTKS